ncbi:hypothetical protein LJK88_12070 [Paenibacillus sp. P26]|nr:hypothetical protein LJK88_12070 [Paenibacillus sp. P26]UUZ89494.1 hypothetical protein LJK87_25610 [Paenibacillus sp. P25]
MKTMKWTLVMLMAAGMLTACTKNQQASPPSTTTPSAGQTGQAGQSGQTGQTGQSGQTGQGGQSTAPAAGVKLTPISYPDVEKQMMTTTAKTSGIKTLYVPQQGAYGDSLNQVGSSSGVMTLEYSKMNIQESAMEIKPSGTAEPEKPVKLGVGEGKWVTVGGQPTLYLKVGETYVAINSAKSVSQEEIQAIAETLKPLQ